jgi:subtilisin family serine protease
VAADASAQARALAGRLRRDRQITLVRTIPQARAPDGCPAIEVIETTPERAAALARTSGVRVEPDQRLGWSPSGTLTAGEIANAVAQPAGELRRAVVVVEDDGGHPVNEAAVYLSGHGPPAMGFTGADGRAELTVPVETAAGPEFLAVRPARDCWPTRVIRPRIPEDKPVTVRCERITTTFPEFLEQPLRSWGAQAMGFGRLPPTYRGQGIRIAIIGSGAATTHPDLANRLSDGRDVIGHDDDRWREDLIGTGTHQAVLIGGQDNGTGVTGLAPEAEVHICRTAPSGTCADLIEALDYCVEREVDVALISTGVAADSMLLAAKISQARQSGIACVAAAGDGGRELACPATLPDVLAVGAVGQLGTFPASSGIAAEVAGPPTADGLFAPGFASYGFGLDCCAPGVAVVSGLPPASYGPLSGTGVAAAHVAAAAALVLAHHPQFRRGRRQPPPARDASRVDRLFELILDCCRPLPAIGPLRSGAGLPDVPVAVGVAPGRTHVPTRMPANDQATPAAAPGPVIDPLRAFLAAMESAGLIPGGRHGADEHA